MDFVSRSACQAAGALCAGGVRDAERSGFDALVDACCGCLATAVVGWLHPFNASVAHTTHGKL